MKAVLDTNVLVSGLFFGGVPRQILEAWADGHFELILTPSIFDEYVQTCDRLGSSHPRLDYQAILATIVGHGTLLPDAAATDPITADPDDDKFMLCARSAGAVVVSGDKHLLDACGWFGVDVLKPPTLSGSPAVATFPSPTRFAFQTYVRSTRTFGTAPWRLTFRGFRRGPPPTPSTRA